MARRKINVVSNELDQAPKTRAAGYGKVIDSMRKEINEAMDRIFIEWNDAICNYLNNPQNQIPVKPILGLEPWDSLSFEVKREKIENGDGFTKTVWHPAFFGDFNNFMHNCYRFEKEWPLKPGEISTIIVIEKGKDDPKMWNVHAEQLEYPGTWSFLNAGTFFHNPNVSDEKFQEIVWIDKKKEEMKEQMKENLEEEIKLEEEEAKKEIDQKKSGEKTLGDKIKWWFGK